MMIDEQSKLRVAETKQLIQVIKLLFRHKLTLYDKQLAVAKGELKSRIGKFKDVESPLKKSSSLSKGLNLL